MGERTEALFGNETNMKMKLKPKKKLKPKEQVTRPVTGRFNLPALVALASLLCLSWQDRFSAVSAAPIVTQTQPIRLGFDATAPVSEHAGDSISLCPLVPPGLPAGLSYDISVSGTANVRMDMGADVTFSYDKANVLAGATLPVNVTYTPTPGGGPNVHVKVPVNISVQGCIKDCFLPDLCDTITIPCTFEAGPTFFTAPLTGDGPVTVPVVSCTVSLNVAGVVDVGSAHIEGSITLSPVPNTGGFPGLAGAGAAFGVTGPASAPVIPVLEWDTAGQTVAANLGLNNPLPSAADVTLRLTPVFHWLATSADLRLVIELGSVFHDVGFSDPSPISLFSGSLGPIYSDVGLDTQVGDAVSAAVGFDPGFAAAIAAGNVPIPLTNPEIQALNTSTTPVLGSVGFTFSTDVTPPTTTASLAPSPTPFGWNNSDVTVTLSATDPGGTGVAKITYSASGAQNIPPTTVNAALAAFMITAPGITTVTFFATDNAGNVESGKTVIVRIDEIAPTITINQPTATQYPHSAVLTLDYTVVDTGGSGLDSFTARLDGATTLAGHGLASGQAIDLLTELALGTHTFRIDAVDKAANTSSNIVTFEIIVTPDSIKADVTHFLASGQIKNSGLANSLLSTLEAAAAARAKGDCNTANNNYQAFINQVTAQIGKGIDPVAGAIMIADAQYLIAHCP